MPANLLISTPAYNATVFSTYTLSIVEFTSWRLTQRPDIDVAGLHLAASANLPMARSAAATMVLDHKEITHLLFVDSDIGFPPQAVGRLVDAGKPFVGCIYPQRSSNREKLFAAARTAPDASTAWRQGTDFVLFDQLERAEGPGGARGLQVEDGFARARQLGMGLTLIRRDVIERMAERYPELIAASKPSERIMGCGETVFQCFLPLQDDTGHYMSEDLSFCWRWTHGCGGELWACLTEPLSHTGQTTYRGRAMDALRPA